MTPFKHSCVLFVDPLGEPLEFYMSPCPSRFKVMQMVRHGGGIFCVSGGPNITRLVEPGTKVLNLCENEKVLFVQYIYDCVEQNVLLDSTPYVVAVNAINTSDISDEEDAPALVAATSPPKTSESFSSDEDKMMVNYVLKNSEDFKRLSIVKFCNQLVQVGVVRKAAESIKERLHHLAKTNALNSIMPLQKSKDFKKLWTSRWWNFFSEDDELNMINYIMENNAYHRIRDFAFFKEMYLKKITPHSARAMMSHFKNEVLNNLQKFDVPEMAKLLFMKHSEKHTKTSTKKKKTVGITVKLSQECHKENEVNGTSNGTLLQIMSSERNKKAKLIKRDKVNGDSDSHGSSIIPFIHKIQVDQTSTSCEEVPPVYIVKEPVEVPASEVTVSVEEVEETPLDQHENVQSATPEDNCQKVAELGSSNEMRSSPISMNETPFNPLDDIENARITASPILRSPASSMNNSIKSSSMENIAKCSPHKRASGRESPSLVDFNAKRKVRTFKLYDPNLSLLSLPDTEDAPTTTLACELEGISQHVQAMCPSSTVPDMCDNLLSDHSNNDCIQESSKEFVNVEKVQSPDHLLISQESTPDYLDSYDVSLLNKLGHNVSHAKAVEDLSQAGDVSMEEQSDSEHDCNITVVHQQTQDESGCQLPDSTSTGPDIDIDVENEPSENMESSMVSVEEEPHDSASSGHSSPVCSEQAVNYVADDEASNTASESGLSQHSSQEQNEGAMESFLTEATVITFKMEREVSKIRRKPAMKSLRKGMEKLKKQMYKQFLDTQVKKILSKPVLTLEEKALLTKYLALSYKTTPEDILLEKCGILQD